MYVIGTVSAASTTTAGPPPHMTSSFSMIEPSEVRMDEVEFEDTIRDGAEEVVTKSPLEIISRGMGRLESDGPISDDVIIESARDEAVTCDTNDGKLI